MESEELKLKRYKMTSDFLTNELSAKMKEIGLPWNLCPISANGVYDMVTLKLDETISHDGFRKLFNIMWDDAIVRLNTILKEDCQH